MNASQQDILDDERVPKLTRDQIMRLPEYVYPKHMNRKQQQLFEAVIRSFWKRGYGPTVGEIAGTFGWNPSLVHYHMTRLRHAGLLRKGDAPDRVGRQDVPRARPPISKTQYMLTTAR